MVTGKKTDGPFSPGGRLGKSLHDDEHMRYLGLLGILEDCSVQVDEETRERIEDAFADACRNNPGWGWKRILNRIELILS